MPKSLSSCIETATNTIDLQEKCMADQSAKYEYGLTPDHLYYKIVKTKTATTVRDSNYHYSGTFTHDQIQKFICNNNMKFTFMSSPYEGERMKRGSLSTFEAEK